MEWITTNDVFAENWRRLLEFANHDLAIEAICKIHKIDFRANKQNIEKQAKQIRVAILQAKEYFDATSSTTLYTSANHLYYGLSSLTTALMLIRGDGKFSLDTLRKDSKNAHHGLKFTTGCTQAKAGSGMELLNSSHAEILTSGHFQNWYKTLPNKDVERIIFTTESKSGSNKVGPKAVGASNTTKPNDLVGSKFSILELIKKLPDLTPELGRYGVPVTHTRITHKGRMSRDGNITTTWLLHNITPRQEVDKILEKFVFSTNIAQNVKTNIGDNENGGSISLQVHSDFIDNCVYSWPDSRITINNDAIAYAEDLKTLEIVDMYMLSYQLSMLSRYFPDLWISCLESQCKGAKLIERCVNIIALKFPILALATLSQRGIIISNHKAPWKQ